MNSKKWLLLCLALLSLNGCIALPFSWEPSPSPSASGSQQPISDTAGIEQELYRLLNAYRAERGLAAIPYSAKLALTARTHAQDSAAYRPDEQTAPVGTECNLHSWSPNGNWTSMCYTSDHRESEKMWSKPREIAGYSGNGYEISAYSTGCQAAACWLEIWKTSPGHNAVMINADNWSDVEWRAVGVGVHGGYAHIWFGKEPD